MKYFTILAAVFLGFAMLVVAQEARAQTVTVVEPSQMQDVCDLRIPDELGAYGCYWDDTDRIYVRGDLAAPLFMFVLAHELGHFFLKGEDLELFRGDKELAANTFATMLLYPDLVTPEQKAYFLAAIRNN